MVKRVTSTLLWFVAVAWAFNFLSAFTDFPQLVGSLVAAAVALFVGIDPIHLIWPALPEEPRVREAAAPKTVHGPSRV